MTKVNATESVNKMITKIEHKELAKFPPSPVLEFTPYAWAKLLYFRDLHDNEISGFGLTLEDYPLVVVDILLVPQVCSMCLTTPISSEKGDFFMRMAEAGHHPQQFGRIWIHTHPGIGPEPSGTDVDTFMDAFRYPDWSVMFILDTSDTSYCKLQFTAGPRCVVKIPVKITWDFEFEATNYELWQDEYEKNVTIDVGIKSSTKGSISTDHSELAWCYTCQSMQEVWFGMCSKCGNSMDTYDSDEYFCPICNAMQPASYGLCEVCGHDYYQGVTEVEDRQVNDTNVGQSHLPIER